MAELTQYLTTLNPAFRHKVDALVFICHAALLRASFVATDPQWNPIKSLPLDWNQGDAYTFHYRHESSSMKFVVKFIPMFTKLIALGSADDSSSGSTQQIELDVSEYVKDDGAVSDYKDYYRNLDRLQQRMGSGIAEKLVPSGASSANSDRFESRGAPPPAYPRDPANRPEPPYNPYFPPPERSPLMIDRRPPIGVGRDDLYGPLSGGFDPTGGGMGGMLMGPNHPFFRGGGRGDGGMGGGGGMFPRGPPVHMPPPGARWDPPRPPMGPGMPGMGADPDFDEFPPNQQPPGSMYL